VIKVEQLPEGAYPLALGDSNNIQVGDSVVAIGNPFALGTSMSYGIISALGRTIPSITPQFNIPEAIQTDAAINPGNSGGPLLNMNGEVIGVNAQIRTGDQGGGNIGIGFAIPVNIVKQVYPSLIENGSYQWPYLGVASSEEQPGFSQPGNQAESQRGALIANIVPDGPAAQAGIQSGDVITRANDQEIRSFDDLLSVIAFHRPGDQLQMTLLRDGQEQTVTVTLGERPSGGLQ
jgi:S1-C subfamily serine protease